MIESVRAPGALATIKRYLLLAYGCFGTMLDVGLMVMGSLLIGLSLSSLLAGFSLVDRDLGLSTAATLASILVLGVAGLFCVGVASEGPLGRGRELVGFSLWEVALGRALTATVVGGLGMLAYSYLEAFTESVPFTFQLGVRGLRAVGLSALTVIPLVGVPAAALARWARQSKGWRIAAEVPVLFLVWAVAVMVMLA